MPIHDWTKVRAGTFHFFHQSWIIRLCDALNGGGLPRGYFAMSEQRVHLRIPDVLTLRTRQPLDDGAETGGVAVAEAPPTTRFVSRSQHEKDLYARKADRITIRRDEEHVVAVIEIASPGNKSSDDALGMFVAKAVRLLNRGIHFAMIDLFPPSRRDPNGLHGAIWDQFAEEQFVLPADKPLTMASYVAGEEIVAYAETVGVGDVLPPLPMFLSPERYIPLPLEATYEQNWRLFPEDIKQGLQ